MKEKGMKKLAIALMAAVLSLCMLGCGQGSSSNKTGTQKADETASAKQEGLINKEADEEKTGPLDALDYSGETIKWGDACIEKSSTMITVKETIKDEYGIDHKKKCA